MPIRFRCAYCNQLLGIARRKAGTVVRCPTCAGQVVVPKPEGALVENEASVPDVRQTSPIPPPPSGPIQPVHPPAKGAMRQATSPLVEPIFERSDFDEVFNPAPVMDVPPPPPLGIPSALPKPLEKPAWSPPRPAPPEFDVVPLINSPAPAPQPIGILLTPLKATLLSVAVIMAIAFAFAAGLLIGFFLAPRPTIQPQGRTPLEGHVPLVRDVLR